MKKLVFIIIFSAFMNNIFLHPIDYEVPYDFEVNSDYFIKYALSFMEEIGIITKKDNYGYIRANSPTVATLFGPLQSPDPDSRLKTVIILFPLSEAKGYAYLTMEVKKNNDIERLISCGSSLGTLDKIIGDQKHSRYSGN